MTKSLYDSHDVYITQNFVQLVMSDPKALLLDA